MKYFIANDGQQSGPFEVSELISKGLNVNSYVWCEGMPNWMPATHVPEVAVLLSQVPPTKVYPPNQSYNNPNCNPQPGKGVDFGQAISICFKKYADFEGRASRSEFWFFYLFNMILSMVTCGIACLATIIPTYAVAARRLHDTGRSGWWLLLGLVPIVGLILIVWWIEDSHEDNEYGPRP